MTITAVNQVESLIRRDPAHRGLIASERVLKPLCLGHLNDASRDLSMRGRRAVIVTGFFIPGANPPAAETDGPPGAALLASALNAVGIPTQIITDEPCQAAVSVAAELMGIDPRTVVALPNNSDSVDGWFTRQASDATTHDWSHLISIERVGPSHTSASAQKQNQSAGTLSEATEFERLVPATLQGECYNMRGQSITEHTAPLHRLFELANQTRAIKTIGIGDGGNEIGMGAIPWWEISRRLNTPESPQIACRIETTWTILAGVSNWGAMALAASTLWRLNKTEVMKEWTSEQQLESLKQLVKRGPAVDGITRLQEATVDGLPFLTYIQPWEGIRRAVGV